MSIWIFDENRADFRPALPGEADPDALHIIQRGDALMVYEDGRERPMPDQMEVAGVLFDREQFEDTRPACPPLIPNDTTVAAMCEARADNLKSYDSVNDLIADLHAGEL
jgi:hypothetical protein